VYRIRLHYDVPQWAYYRRCHAIKKHAPPDFQVDMGEWHPCVRREQWPAEKRYDLILQLVPDREHLRKHLDKVGHHETVVVGGLNVGYGHHTERLRMCRDYADHIVVNNRDCWDRLGHPADMTWISNGVDRAIYRISRRIESREPQILWTGCEFHSGKHTNIKGYHEVLLPLAKRLEAWGIPYSFRKVISEIPERCFTTEEMVDWYNHGTIYVCASSSEGTPNPALEAASCGCIVISTAIGNMPELIEPGYNGELVERTVDALADAIRRCLPRYKEMAAAMQRVIEGWDWRFRAVQYYDLFRRLIDTRRIR